jgi:uncharacterized protein (TIGR03435 family)
VFTVHAIAQRVSRPLFDVASVKAGDAAGLQSFTLAGGRFFAENTPLREFIKYAWNITDWQLIGAPGWVDSERYTIEAKKPNAGLNIRRDDQLRQMMKSLLADRFSLVLHKEAKNGIVYALTVDKGGLKIPSLPFPADPSAHSGTQFNRFAFVADHSSMADVALILSQRLHYLVLDETGAQGAWSFVADFSNGDPPDVQYLISQLPGKLGLKVERRTGPTDIYVVDQVKRPEPN